MLPPPTRNSARDSAPVCQSGSQPVLEKELPPPGKFTQTAVLKQWVNNSWKLEQNRKDNLLNGTKSYVN